MSNLPILDCLQPALAKLERVRFFPRQLLTADDLVAEQEYFRQKMRRHNRFLHGWGTVCGLEVTASPGDRAPWRVEIGAGYALGPYGDEIFVAEAVHLDLAHCGSGATLNPCEPAPQGAAPAAGATVFVAVKYAECEERPVQGLAAGCGCDDTPCEYSRIRDSFEVTCLDELPSSHTAEKPEAICHMIARGRIPPLLPCPDDPWVVLARVHLPAAATRALEDSMIHNFAVRHQLYSTTLLQQQLIRCCCHADDAAPRPVRVVSVSPADGSRQSITGRDARVRVVVTFDKALKADSAQPEAIQVAASRKGKPVPDAAKLDARSFKYDAAARSLSVTGTFEPADDIDYRVTVRGKGANHIRDVDGLALDGKGDGTPGDNFVSHFTVGRGK